VGEAHPTPVSLHVPRWGWLLGWGVATGALAASLVLLDHRRILEALAGIQIPWLLPALLLNLTVPLLWSGLWFLLLPGGRRIPFPSMAQVVAVTAMAVNTVPFLAGQAVGVLLLARRPGVGHSAALSVLAQDQLVEGVAKVTLLLLVLSVTPLPDWLRAAAVVAVGGVLLLGLLLGVAAWAGRRCPPGVAGAPEFSAGEGGVPRRIQRFIFRWAEQLEALRRPGVLTVALVLALAMKGAEAGALRAVQLAFGAELPLWSVLPVLLAVNLATMIQLSPGNLGVYEGAVFLIYRWLGVPAELAVGMALVHHAVLLLSMLAPGYLVIVVRSWGGARERSAPDREPPGTPPGTGGGPAPR